MTTSIPSASNSTSVCSMPDPAREAFFVLLALSAATTCLGGYVSKCAHAWERADLEESDSRYFLMVQNRESSCRPEINTCSKVCFIASGFLSLTALGLNFFYGCP